MQRIHAFLLACVWALAMAATPCLAEPVDINHADAATIAAALSGVGQKKAEAIVAYRAEHGSFRSPEELARVKGIGARTVQINRENIRLKRVSTGK